MERILVVLLLICSCCCNEYEFPSDFKFGVATAAYQVEGAWNESGRGECIWDHLTHTNPDAIAEKHNGDIACDAYHKTKEDVQLLKNLGVNFYRFSISWSRILPTGKIDQINPDGIRYYNELINELLENGIEPMVTMHHFDTPQALEEIGGFLNFKIADYFVDYANLLFENFGDRVKNWITFNEAHPVCFFGYGADFLAPMHNLKNGEVYTCSRTILLAHARTYRLYDDRYRETQGGKVGITNVHFWFEPLSDNDEDREAADIAQEYYLGWFSNPIFSKNGDFPQLMKDTIARTSKENNLPTSKLQEFTTAEVDLIRGSADFFGLNHYTTYFCTKTSEDEEPGLFLFPDIGVTCTADETLERAHSYWLRVNPEGFRKTFNWIKEHYDNPEVIVTENGYSDGGNYLNDCRRVNYYNRYLTELLKAKYEDGCNISGYTAWSFMDNFEWRSGYTERFGLYAVDFEDPDRSRTAKMSAHVYRNMIDTRRIDWDYTPQGFDKCKWSEDGEEYDKIEL